VACWSCAAEVPPGAPACGACGRLQPVDPRDDPFSLLGLPRAFAIDPEELDGAWRERSRRVHPDRFAKAEPRERRLALERATRLNDAHRLLRDWRARAACLLALAGREPLGGARDVHDPGFLEEQLALREALAVARADGDAARLDALAREGRRRLDELRAEVGALLAGGAAAGDRARDVARLLARARYFDHLTAEAGRGAAPAAR
jgi:molecular chaperone HscB